MKHLLASLLLALTSIAHAVPAHAQERSEKASSPAAFEQSIENAKAEMMATPAKALVHSETALRLAEGQAGKTGAANRATALWLKAESLPSGHLACVCDPHFTPSGRQSMELPTG